MILIVDDDKTIRLSLTILLKTQGYSATAVGSPDEAIAAARSISDLSLVIMDMNFTRATTGEEGLELLRKFRVLRPEIPVILITAWGSIPLAVDGMKLGAFDFITKPWNNQLLLQRIETAISLSKPQRNEAQQAFNRSEIIGNSNALNDVLATAARVAATNAPVLILGENGTGKELVAHAIHANSPRRNNNFVMVNLGGISQSLFESEMFGHVKGAFTGAVDNRKGRFELADNGTIFLDEIGELDLNCQVKLLRVLQQHSFERLGDSSPRHSDFRLIAATNANLNAMVADHTFREDLLYRINLITLHLPPLRERTADIPLLVEHFANAYTSAAAMPKPQISADAMEFLCQLPYPGNIRELKNLVERTILVNNVALLDASHFRLSYNGNTTAPVATNNTYAEPTASGGTTLEQLERDAIVAALNRFNGNISHVAASLGITRQTLYRKLEKYNITPPSR